MNNSPNTVLNPDKTRAKYPEVRVIVLDDSFNTFQHVANCLLTIIPSMSEQRAWDLTIKVDKTGSAEVWRGNCLLYTSPSPRDLKLSRMPSSA